MIQVTQRQKNQLPAFDALAWAKSWDSFGRTFSGVNAVRSLTEEECDLGDTYSAYENGKLAAPSSENMPEIVLESSVQMDLGR